MEKNEQKNEEQDLKQNTSSEDNQEQQEDNQEQQQDKKKGGIHNNALYAASMGRSATRAVDPHSDSSLAQTGTNISYEGPTAPGGAGSVGTGYASGQSGTGAATTDRADYDQGGSNRASNEPENTNEEERKDNR